MTEGTRVQALLPGDVRRHAVYLEVRRACGAALAILHGLRDSIVFDVPLQVTSRSWRGVWMRTVDALYRAGGARRWMWARTRWHPTQASWLLVAAFLDALPRLAVYYGETCAAKASLSSSSPPPSLWTSPTTATDVDDDVDDVYAVASRLEAVAATPETASANAYVGAARTATIVTVDGLTQPYLMELVRDHVGFDWVLRQLPASFVLTFWPDVVDAWLDGAARVPGRLPQAWMAVPARVARARLANYKDTPYVPARTSGGGGGGGGGAVRDSKQLRSMQSALVAAVRAAARGGGRWPPMRTHVPTEDTDAAAGGGGVCTTEGDATTDTDDEADEAAPWTDADAAAAVLALHASAPATCNATALLWPSAAAQTPASPPRTSTPPPLAPLAQPLAAGDAPPQTAPPAWPPAASDTAEPHASPWEWQVYCYGTSCPPRAVLQLAAHLQSLLRLVEARGHRVHVYHTAIVGGGGQQTRTWHVRPLLAPCMVPHSPLPPPVHEVDLRTVCAHMEGLARQLQEALAAAISGAVVVTTRRQPLLPAPLL